MNVVCSACAAVNRVPETKRHDKPICGRCGESLLPPHPVDLTAATFAKFIGRNDVPVLVDFWAPWCGPCRAMAPAFAQAAARLSPRMILSKLNTEDHGSAAAPFSITGIPTMILFRGGREVGRQSGALSEWQIVQWARSLEAGPFSSGPGGGP